MHDYVETLEWYATHQTAREIGFNPDGMCLKICRTAREIGPRYATAKIAQDATPAKYRVTNVRDLRKGMVLFFDDPNDSNTAGHVAGMIGRVKDFDPDDLNDVLCETNSVKSGELVVVRATYFLEHWGDPFTFGSNYLNGMVLDTYEKRTRVQQFKRSGPNFNVGLLKTAIHKDGRVDIVRYVDQITTAVKSLPNDKRRVKITRFKEEYNKRGILRMDLLDTDVAQPARKKINSVIKSLPAK